MRGVDLETFRFDYDLTFAVLLMDGAGNVYSRFGTREAGSHTDRMSLAGLKNAMHEVLLLHKDAEGARAEPADRPRRVIDDIPAFQKSKASEQYCAHCHFVNNYRFRQLRAEGKLRKDLLFQHPYPEQIGIRLEVDHNNVIEAILPGSPAEKAGLRKGDVVERAGPTRVLTSADLQFALDGVPDPGQIAVRARRGGTVLEPAVLDLPPGWRRKADISWRQGIDGTPPELGFWGKALDEAGRKARGLGPADCGLEVTFLFPGDAWKTSRGDLKTGDVVLGWNGERPGSLDIRQFHSRFRLAFEVGDRPVLDVLRKEKRIQVPVVCQETPEE